MTVPIAEAPMTKGIRYAREESAGAYAVVMSRAPAAGSSVGVDEKRRRLRLPHAAALPPQGVRPRKRAIDVPTRRAPSPGSSVEGDIDFLPERRRIGGPEHRSVGRRLLA